MNYILRTALPKRRKSFVNFDALQAAVRDIIFLIKTSVFLEAYFVASVVEYTFGFACCSFKTTRFS